MASALSNRAALSPRSVGAIDDYRESISLLQSIARSHQHDRTLISELAITQNNLGRLLVALRNTNAAIQHFESAARLLEQLCEVDHHSDHFRSSLGGVLHNLARTQAATGQRSMAKITFERSIELQRSSLQTPNRLSTHARQTRQQLLDKTISEFHNSQHSS